MTRAPYPLQWPHGVARTLYTARVRSRFGGGGGLSFSRARKELLVELERLGAANVVLTSDLPVRGDGLPYASGRADDPGIAVWCIVADATGRGIERVFACDAWLTHAENMTAIARSIEAMRGLERWGMAEAAARAFAGFAALPAPATGWRAVLGVDASEQDLAAVRRRYHTAMREAHPDFGGSAARTADIAAAFEAAREELEATL